MKVPERSPDLLERLRRVATRSFEGVTFRVVWRGRSAVQGSKAGRGRWNDPDCRFEVLNTSLVREGAAAEFEAFWSLFEQRPDRRALNWKLRLRLNRVTELDFTDLEELGVGRKGYSGRDYRRTQEISATLNHLGCEGLIVPSARYQGKNLIVFMQNLNDDCRIDLADSIQFSWQV